MGVRRPPVFLRSARGSNPGSLGCEPSVLTTALRSTRWSAARLCRQVTRGQVTRGQMTRGQVTPLFDLPPDGWQTGDSPQSFQHERGVTRWS